MPTLSTRRGLLRQMVFAAEPVVENPGGHVLVVVFMRGGADTLNLLVPHGDDEYYRRRPTLGIARPGGGVDVAVDLDKFYGLHPKLAGLAPIFKEGRLGFIQGVGTDNPTGSHFEAQDQLERGEAYNAPIGGGWLGRHLRSRVGAADGQSALAGVAIGETLPESLRGAPAAAVLRSVDDLQLPELKGKTGAASVSKALAAMYETEVGLLGNQGRQTMSLLRKVEALRNKPYTPENKAQYPADDFGKALREVARLIKADLGLEVACVDSTGWDTHFFQGTTGGVQAGLISSLGAGLAAFDADLLAHKSRVTTLVLTEFGRRVYENTSAGTDHGRGFAMMAMGGKIVGGKVHGAWPGLKEDQGIPNLPGPGGMEVKIDYRSVLAEVLEHCVGYAKLDAVFPGYTPTPVGISVKPIRNASRA